MLTVLITTDQELVPDHLHVGVKSHLVTFWYFSSSVGLGSVIVRILSECILNTLSVVYSTNHGVSVSFSPTTYGSSNRQSGSPMSPPTSSILETKTRPVWRTKSLIIVITSQGILPINLVSVNPRKENKYN